MHGPFQSINRLGIPTQQGLHIHHLTNTFYIQSYIFRLLCSTRFNLSSLTSMTSSRDSPKSAKTAKQSIGFSLPSKASDSKLAEVRPASSLEKRTRNQDEVIDEFSEYEAIKRGDKFGPLVIEGSKNRDWKSEVREEPMTEYDAYKRAVAAAPEPSNIEDYEHVPVEEFGAALLRGMGWNGQKIGGVKEVKRRQNLLGLGVTVMSQEVVQ
ncbi:hypothetical protein K3495_g6886 [Podosphaera aphanis]|nr:hypothetical protein K3495_g6886 [Podosphaera aphanis]